ncbi:MAG: GNAT family protein [Actinomycetota bacterium]
MDALALTGTDWPLFGLTLRTERLELRMPTDTDLAGVVAAIRTGIVGDEPYPLSAPWAIEPEPLRTRNALSFHWRCRSSITPDSFHLPFAVVHDGEIVGTQAIGARDFQTLRTISTGSWIATPWQGRGFAREMRAAVLQLGFEHLGATVATSSARQTTDRSIRVSVGLGYRENGRLPFAFGDEVAEEVHFRLDRSDWAAGDDRPEVAITGWEACVPMFEPQRSIRS